MHYDPNRDPDPREWLQRSDAERLDACARAHHPLPRRHPPLGNPRLHAALHVTVEQQLAGDAPPEVRKTLSRLMRAGLSRHEAIHAVGDVAALALAKVVKTRQPFDAEAYAEALRALDPNAIPRVADNDDGNLV